MIRSLEGIVSALGENNLVLTVNHIGYLVYTPLTREQFVPGESTKLHTHLVVRENALDLYGFVREEELSFFELLLSVPKIGPKSALQVLCQADPSLLASSILTQDADSLHKLSGIGKKTALNIVTHLAGKIDNIQTIENGSPTLAATLSQNQVDAIDALITLGYDPQEARMYVLRHDKSEDTKTLVQSVLKEIPIP
jgi:Holliday junction DNA helicase RuvA